MNRCPRSTWMILASVLCLSAVAGAARADEADAFFDDSYVHEVRIYFDDPNWYDILFNSHASDPNDPYFPARFEYGEVVLDPVGVRFKGNSSFSIPTVKKSFKIDFDEYDEDNDALRFMGLKKLNLNNSFKDPTMLREMLFLGFAAQYNPTIRAAHTRVYVNDVLWGLYTAVEQVDKTFCQSRFGESEDGNLFEGEPSDGFHEADLTWLGSDPAPYHDYYELKTNEAGDDYSQLIDFIDILNNTPPVDLPAQLEPVLDVEGAIFALALNNLFVNLDSYNGSAHNYYLYDRDDTGRFTHIHWDTNEAFGRFLMGVDPWDDPLELDPFWLPVMGPPPPTPAPRPLMESLWAVDSYQRMYLRDLARMLREGFDVATMEPRINELADIIRADVYADPHKMYTNAQFEANLYDNIYGAGPDGLIYGLRNFVQQRAAFMDARLDSFASRSDLALNELMPSNASTLQDGAGDYDPWLEIYNQGPGLVQISGVFLTDDPGDQTKWTLPNVQIDDGEFLVLWIDGETGEGADHASFSLLPGGGELYLYKQSGLDMELIDSVAYGAVAADESYGRFADGAGDWQTMNIPTPGAANQENDEPVVLYINEFMADNDNTIEDPDEPNAYEDWIEIYNPGAEAIDLGGMYLTDDLVDLVQWQIPAGVTIDAGGYALFWADSDDEQGDYHTNFKLGASGEEIGLTDTDGVSVIDSIVFGQQYADVSYGRYPDGDAAWGYMASSTPGSANGPHNAPPMIADTAHTPASPTAADQVWVTSTVTDADGSVAGVTLTYDAGGGAVVVTMYDDGAHQDGAAGDDVYGGDIPAFGEGTIVYYYVSATDNLGAETTDPADAPATRYSYMVGYAPPEIVINEFMANNDTVIEDPDEPDAFEDWIELYNAGGVTVDLGGMYLTDDLTAPTQYQIPVGVNIAPGEYVLFWADDDDEQGDYHTNFKLGASGEDIGLFDNDAHGNVAIDTLTFGQQQTDVSYGRSPDGGATWYFMYCPTPGATNYIVGDTDCDGDVDLSDLAALLAAFGACAGDAGYDASLDFDNSGCIDLSDLATLLANFGYGA